MARMQFGALSKTAEQFAAELEEEGLFLTLGEDVSTLVFRADPDGDRRVEQELLDAHLKHWTTCT
jgi:glutamate/tyrosine decarboxylase-like PLP-dependent enzyme